MFEADEDGVYARIGIAPARFYFALAVQVMLGLLLLYMAYISPAGLIGKLLIMGLGIGMLVQANRLRLSSDCEILLTDAGLVTQDGVMLAPLDQIKEVSRGSFAFKPSNGFAVTLTESLGFLWVPGLWWRFGKRVGIGGVTGAGAAKFMAEQISYKIAMRG